MRILSASTKTTTSMVFLQYNLPIPIYNFGTKSFKGLLQRFPFHGVPGPYSVFLKDYPYAVHMTEVLLRAAAPVAFALLSLPLPQAGRGGARSHG